MGDNTVTTWNTYASNLPLRPGSSESSGIPFFPLISILPKPTYSTSTKRFKPDHLSLFSQPLSWTKAPSSFPWINALLFTPHPSTSIFYSTAHIKFSDINLAVACLCSQHPLLPITMRKKSNYFSCL